MASNAAASTASKPTATASLAGPGCTTSRWARSSSRQVQRAVGRLAGDEADDVGQHGRERVGLRELEDEVAELDLVVHGRSSRSGQRPAASRGKSRSVFVAQRVGQRAGRVAGGVEPLAGDRDDEVGGEREVAAVVEVLERREREQRVQLARDRRPGEVVVEAAEVAEHVDRRVDAQHEREAGDAVGDRPGAWRRRAGR